MKLFHLLFYGLLLGLLLFYSLLLGLLLFYGLLLALLFSLPSPRSVPGPKSVGRPRRVIRDYIMVRRGRHIVREPRRENNEMDAETRYRPLRPRTPLIEAHPSLNISHRNIRSVPFSVLARTWQDGLPPTTLDTISIPTRTWGWKKIMFCWILRWRVLISCFRILVGGYNQRLIVFIRLYLLL